MLAVTPDARFIITGRSQSGGNVGCIELWDFKTGALLRRDKWPHYELTSILATPDSRAFAVSGRDDHTYHTGTRYLKLGRVETRQYDELILGDNDRLELSFTWDKRYIKFGDQLWDWQTKQAPQPNLKRLTSPQRLELSETQDLICGPTQVYVMNNRTLQLHPVFHPPPIESNSQSFKVTSNGQYLISFLRPTKNTQAHLGFWDMQTGALVKEYEHCKAGLIDVTGDSQYAVIMTFAPKDKRLIQVIKLDSGEILLQFANEPIVRNANV